MVRQRNVTNFAEFRFEKVNKQLGFGLGLPQAISTHHLGICEVWECVRDSLQWCLRLLGSMRARSEGYVGSAPEANRERSRLARWREARGRARLEPPGKSELQAASCEVGAQRIPLGSENGGAEEATRFEAGRRGRSRQKAATRLHVPAVLISKNCVKV